jgi:hypothetical protein
VELCTAQFVSHLAVTQINPSQQIAETLQTMAPLPHNSKKWLTYSAQQQQESAPGVSV